MPVPALAMLLIALAIGQAAAQVSVDQRALEPLQPNAKRSSEKPKPPAHPPPQHPARSTQQTPARHPPPPHEALTTPPPPPQPAPFVALTPPPPPVIPAPVAVPVRPMPPPPPPTLAADAPDTATPIPSGLRITFGTDRSDLNPATDEVLRAMARAHAEPGTTFTILSYASGTPSDASAARRLSLERALTLRSVLINAGVASERIYVRALGATAPTAADGPLDRADLTVADPATKSAAETSAPPKATP